MHGASGPLPLLVVAALLAGCTERPNFRTSDKLGPIPRFAWIEPGQPRPAPAIAEVALPCYRAADAPVCMRQAFRGALKQLGQRELAEASDGGRSYRYINDPACAAPLAIRLDVRADGSGLVTVSGRGGPPPARGVDWSLRTFVAPAGAVARVENALAHSAFERIAPDPRALATDACYDGQHDIFEAVRRGRYRYVHRQSCEPNHAEVKALGEAMVRLLPTPPPAPGRC